ncbi:MAG: tetratricopeptide repeat protein [Polyangiaceae bacterium]|nr:tetratricopeptide repeat protein [Polyangiaceae bacterium]
MKRGSPSRRLAGPWLLAGALAMLAACASERPQPAPRPCPSEASSAAAIDPPLLAFLSKARSLHHQADVAEAEQDAPRAVGALERIVAEPPPKPLAGRPEVEEVLSDAFARLAELRTGQGDFGRASADIERGLTHATEPSYFRGHLFEVRGLVEERHADALAREGKGDDAKQARRRAIEASEEAVRIQDEVIRRAVGGKP